MYKDRNITVRRKAEYSEHLAALLNFLSCQHAWICILHGKVSGREEPETVSLDIGVGGTPNLERNASLLSSSFYLNEGIPRFGGFGGSPSRAEPKLVSRHTQTKKRKRKRTQNREDQKELNSDEAGTDSPPADEEPSSPQTEVTLREDIETHTTPSETSILDLTSFEQGTKPRRRGERHPKGRETPPS